MPGPYTKTRLLSILNSNDKDTIKDSFSDFIYTVVDLENTEENRAFVLECLRLFDKYYTSSIFKHLGSNFINSKYNLLSFLGNKFPKLDLATYSKPFGILIQSGS